MIRQSDLTLGTTTRTANSAASARLANLAKAEPGEARTSPLPHRCGRCKAHWAGSRTAHCGACHTTFTAVDSFDEHRRGGQCAAPWTIGLILADGRAYNAWRRPGETTEEAS